LGSFPTITLRIPGTARTSAATFDAKSARASFVKGVVREPGFMTCV
jgi:hypothetical protein